jgi:hypothetical protein
MKEAMVAIGLLPEITSGAPVDKEVRASLMTH